MSCARHDQAPIQEHEMKTRHADWPRSASHIFSSCRKNWSFSHKAKYARLRTSSSFADYSCCGGHDGCCHPPLADSAFACRRSRATLRREHVKDHSSAGRFLWNATIIPKFRPCGRRIFRQFRARGSFDTQGRAITDENQSVRGSLAASALACR